MGLPTYLIESTYLCGDLWRSHFWTPVRTARGKVGAGCHELLAVISNILFRNSFLQITTLVATFYTYPDPTPGTPTAGRAKAARRACKTSERASASASAR